ncbi:MAG: hypothetical protein ABIQ51_04015 [Mesorhizobium sp.]
MPACEWRLPALPVLTYSSTLRSGSQKPPFSARPDLNLKTPDARLTGASFWKGLSARSKQNGPLFSGPFVFDAVGLISWPGRQVLVPEQALPELLASLAPREPGQVLVQQVPVRLAWPVRQAS